MQSKELKAQMSNAFFSEFQPGLDMATVSFENPVLFEALVFILDAQGGVVIWDPAVYYFSEVPNTIDLPSAIITMIGAVIFSLIGAAIPAARAADIDPAKALRYE